MNAEPSTNALDLAGQLDADDALVTALMGGALTLVGLALARAGAAMFTRAVRDVDVDELAELGRAAGVELRPVQPAAPALEDPAP